MRYIIKMNETGGLGDWGETVDGSLSPESSFGQEPENRPLSPLQCMEEIKYAS